MGGEERLGAISILDHTSIAIGTRTCWISDEEKFVLLVPEDRGAAPLHRREDGLGKSTLLRNLILQKALAALSARWRRTRLTCLSQAISHERSQRHRALRGALARPIADLGEI